MHEQYHRSDAELEAGIPEILKSPAREGRVEIIVARPDRDLRELPTRARFTPEEGLEGDRWSRHCSRRLPDGKLNPDTQITIMNSRVAALIAGDRDRWPLAGDNLFVDFDISIKNLPPGSRVRAGEVTLEITEEPHTGCSKFSRRFGRDALAFVNSMEGKELRLRGVNAKVIVPGEIELGDLISKL